MKFPIRLLSVCVLLLMTPLANAQIFPNAFWNKGKGASQASQSCPNGVCPNNVQSFSTSNNVPGHWTYPGVSITRHLEQEHGVSTAGLNRQQQLNLHDSLHEGGTQQEVFVAPTYKSYGSTGSVQSYGSTGSVTSYSTVTTDSSVKSLRRKSSFRPAFLEAVKRAKESGQINAFQARILTRKSANDRWLADVESDVRAAAIEEGVASATGQIDWDAIIAFIEKLIPLIIQLIDLFGYSSHLNPDIQYAYNSQPSYYLAA